MKHLKIAGRFLLLLLLLSGCKSTQNIEADTNKSLSDEEFLADAYFLEGLRLKTIGNLESALENLEKAREIETENPVFHYQLAEVNTQLGNFRAAIHYAENAVGLDVDNVWYHVLLVQLYQNAGLFAKATGEMEEIIRLEPRKLEFYFMLSNLYMSIGDSKAAISTLDKAEKEFGVIDMIIVEKESIYLDAGKEDKAIKEVKKLINAFPDVLRYQVLLAELYIAINDFDDAKVIYDKLIDENIEDGRILLAMSEFYRSQKDYDKAFTYLKDAFADENLDLDIKVEMLVGMITSSGYSQVEMDTQQEIFDVLLQTHPAEPKALTVYSDFLVKKGDYATARENIREVLKTVRDKYIIWEQLLYVNNHLEDFETLLHDSDTIIQLFPIQPLPYLFNSIAAYQLEKNDKAISSAETGLLYAKNEPQIQVEFLIFMGESHYRKKQYEKSDSAFTEILKIDPSNVFVLNNFAYYLSLRGEKLEKAKQMSKKLIGLAQNNPSYLDTHGWVLYQMKDYEGAEKYIKQALEDGGSDRPAVLEHYGDVLYQLNRTEEAKTYWKKALKYDEANKALKQKISTGKL
ncbi:MAG: tetratricopeptide repeat protein [Bacteroidales bacterium]|jgi:tetratricopeptide (TPR) repeat protein|nr:tetratricopeptide repeat protein [Bacteroidales bacterium]